MYASFASSLHLFWRKIMKTNVKYKNNFFHACSVIRRGHATVPGIEIRLCRCMQGTHRVYQSIAPICLLDKTNGSAFIQSVSGDLFPTFFHAFLETFFLPFFKTNRKRVIPVPFGHQHIQNRRTAPAKAIAPFSS